MRTVFPIQPDTTGEAPKSLFQKLAQNLSPHPEEARRARAPLEPRTNQVTRMRARLLKHALSLLQIVVHHLAEAKRQVGDKVGGGNHAAHGQAGDIAHCVLEKLDGGGPDHAPFRVTFSR